MQKAEEETSFNYHKKKVLRMSACMYVALLWQMFMNWRCPHYIWGVNVHIIIRFQFTGKKLTFCIVYIFLVFYIQTTCLLLEVKVCIHTCTK